MRITDEQYEQIKQPLRDFYSYLRQNHYIRYKMDTIRDELPEINAKEKELNKLVQSVLHTDQEYDWLEFFSDNLATRYGVDNFFNSL